jgi:predicted XRE-type DNA-binding protein
MSFFEERWAHMTDVQREQFKVLAALVRDLKHEVLQRQLEHEDISNAEPRLAAPRSSLNPTLMS